MKVPLVLSFVLAVSCGRTPPRAAAEAVENLADHDGALLCGSLEEAKGPLSDHCKPDTRPSVTLRVEAPPIRASRWRVLAALLDADQFGGLPRPMPPGFEAPPAPHSVRRQAAPGSPFLDHYKLFWGLLSAATLRVDVRRDSIEVVQLWRIDNVWSERDIRDGYPEIGAEALAARVGTPIMPDGAHTIVRFTLRSDGELTRLGVVQTGTPEFNRPIFAIHWQALYFRPLREFLEPIAGSATPE